MTRHYSLRLDLLDEQVLDAEELPIGRVDDLEMSPHPDGAAPTVDSLLVGMQAYGERIGGMLGSLSAGIAGALRDDEGPTAIPCTSITRVDEHVHLRETLPELRGVAGLEKWLREHVIKAIPGSG